MFKILCRYTFVLIIIMQFSEMIFASDGEDLYTTEQKELSSSCRIFYAGDRREDRMLEEYRNKKKLSLILPKLCKDNNIENSGDSPVVSNNSIKIHPLEDIVQHRSHCPYIDEMQNLQQSHVEEHQKLRSVNVFDESLESLLNTTQVVQDNQSLNEVSHKKTVKRLVHFKSLDSESFSFGCDDDVSLYNGERLDDFLLSDEAVSFSPFFEEQNYKIQVSPSTEFDKKSEGEVSV